MRTRKIFAAVFAPVDIAGLAAFRMAFGALMLVLVGRYFAHGWIDLFYRQPQLFFPYEGLEWIRPWPGWGMTAHFIALGICAMGIMFGAWTRVCSALFCLGFTYAHLIDKTNYLNHYHLISLLSGLLVVFPSGRAWSMDAWRSPRKRTLSVPAWTVWLLRYQLAVVYVFAGLAKLNPDWVWHAQPLRIWLAGLSDLPLVGPWLSLPFVAYGASLAGIAFDLGVVPALLWRRTRAVAYLAVVGFHLATAAFFPIGIFPWLMIGLTPIFFDPTWPRRLFRVAAAAPAHRAPVTPRWAWGTGVALAAYVAVQSLVPLRPLWSHGDLLWSEEGFRFGWRVMLMEKYGEVVLVVSEPGHSRRQRVDPRTYLTPLQYRMMATQPDMIVQFVHWLAHHEEQRLGGPIEVRADAVVSLNGRAPLVLIDPEIDLAKITYRRGRNTWIVSRDRTDNAQKGTL